MTEFVYLHGFASGPSSQKATAFKNKFKEIGVSLNTPDLEGGNFEKSNFTSANLTRANFKGASLIEATFKDSNLFESDFTGANILNANFEGANLNNTTWTDGRKCTLGSIGECKK